LRIKPAVAFMITVLLGILKILMAITC